MSRRPRDGSPARNLTFRVYDEDRAAWEAAAEVSDARNLSAWITRVLNEAVKRATVGERAQ